MSLVFFKNLFVRRGKKRVYKKIDNFDARSWSSAPTLTNDEDNSESGGDIESQKLIREEISEKLPMTQDSKIGNPAKFKVDARVISDAIIGLSDGLTVPFALTAGLSAIGNTRVVIFGGMAELIAGAISMGLGGYLGAKSEQDSYQATLSETANLIATSPATIQTTITTIFTAYDVPEPTIAALTSHLSTSPHLLNFLMRFEHIQPEPASSRAFTCALTIALGYFLGGFVPLLPYFFVPQDNVYLGLYWSIGIMTIALFVFGYVKTCFVKGWKGWRKTMMGAKGGIEMIFVGGLAAAAAMGLVKAFDRNPGMSGGA